MVLARAWLRLIRTVRETANGKVLCGLAAGAAGGILFHLLSFPAAWLSGSIVGAAIAAALKVKIASTPLLQSAALVVLGFAIGSNVSPATLPAATAWLASLAILFVSVIATIALVHVGIRTLLRWDRLTSLLSSIPGAFTTIAVQAAASGADLNRVVGAHLTRLSVIALIFPTILLSFDAGEVGHVARGADGGGVETALALAVSTAVALLFWRMRAPASPLLGALVASVTLHGASLSSARLPVIVMNATYIAIGASIGARINSVRSGLDLSAIAAGVLAVGAGLAVAMACAFVATRFVDASFAALVLAYAHGGIEVMMVLSLATGLDPAFTGVHQTLRYIALTAATPWFWKRFVSRG